MFIVLKDSDFGTTPVYSVEVKITDTAYFLVRYQQSADSPSSKFNLVELCFTDNTDKKHASYRINCTKLIPMIMSSYMFNILYKRIQIEVAHAWYERKRKSEEGETN